MSYISFGFNDVAKTNSPDATQLVTILSGGDIVSCNADDRI